MQHNADAQLFEPTLLGVPPDAGIITHRPLSSSFWGLPSRIPNMNHEKELLRGLWVESKLVLSFKFPRCSISLL